MTGKFKLLHDQLKFYKINIKNTATVMCVQGCSTTIGEMNASLSGRQYCTLGQVAHSQAAIHQCKEQLIILHMSNMSNYQQLFLSTTILMPVIGRPLGRPVLTILVMEDMQNVSHP
jgi:hypothetical protein